MKKNLKLRVRSAVTKGRKILRRKPSSVAGEKTTRGRQLSRLKKIIEKVRSRRKSKPETKRKGRQALKVLGHAFEGSFNVAMKNTADFIKERRKKRQRKTIL
jgi:hypothetical protein